MIFLIYAEIPTAIDIRGNIANDGQMQNPIKDSQILLSNIIRDILHEKANGKVNESLISHFIFILLNNLGLNDQIIMRTVSQMRLTFDAKVKGIRLKDDKIKCVSDFVIKSMTSNEIVLNLELKASDIPLEKYLTKDLSQLIAQCVGTAHHNIKIESSPKKTYFALLVRSFKFHFFVIECTRNYLDQMSKGQLTEELVVKRFDRNGEGLDFQLESDRQIIYSFFQMIRSSASDSNIINSL